MPKIKFTDQVLVILSASHNNEEKHIKLIVDVLSKINLDEKDLQC
jgi:L-asparaginase II